MSNQTATVSTPVPAPTKPAPAPAAARTKRILEGPIFTTLMKLSAPNVLNLLAFTGMRTGDPSLGSFTDATILKRFGDVPDNLDEL